MILLTMPFTLPFIYINQETNFEYYMQETTLEIRQP